MTKDDVIRLAREAVSEKHEREFGVWQSWEELEAFAKLVAEHEREMCAQICEMYSDTDSYQGGITTEFHAIMIRKRGES